MKHARHRFGLIFLLASVALIVLPHLSNLPPAVLIFFYALWAWRFAGIWRPAVLPGRMAVFGLTVIGLALVYSQHQGLFGRNAGTILIVTALSLKIMEIRSERDIYLINFLAFVVAASQLLFRQGVLMAVYIGLVCCVLLATLVGLNSPGFRAAAALRQAGILLLQAVPIAAVLFVLFPRLQAPHWLLYDQNDARSGLSETLEPGSISQLALSDELVFRARFLGPAPPPGQRYWRGPVLVLTDGRKWLQSKSASQKLPVRPHFYGTPYRYSMMMEPQAKNWVFALDMPADYPSLLEQNANYQLTTTLPPERRSEYTLGSFPAYETQALSAQEIQEALSLPAGDYGKIKRLVERLGGSRQPPRRYIERVLTHFRDENFRYTLTPPLMQENPVETFLFDARQGFCSHYAAAFVYLMRLADIPARIVTGYQGGRLNKAGGFLEVIQADAHAWTEVWLKGQGWVRIDPTAAIAPERIEHAIASDLLAAGDAVRFAPDGVDAGAVGRWLSQARQLWGNVDYQWQRWIINYDHGYQARLLSARGLGDYKLMAACLGALTAAVLGLLALYLLPRNRKRPNPVLAIYARFCAKAARRGLARHACEGPLDFAARMKNRWPASAVEIERITAAFVALHYGPQVRPRDVKNFRRQVARFKI